MKINSHLNINSIQRTQHNKITFELQRERIKILDRKKKQYENYIIQLKEQIRLQDQELFSLDNQVTQYRTENHALRQQLSMKEEDGLRMDEYAKLIEKLRQQKQFLNQKMYALKYELKEQQNKCYQLTHQNQILKSRIQKISKEVQQLKNHNADIQKISRKLPSMIITNTPQKQREILELSFHYHELNEEVKKYQKIIEQTQRDDQLKRNERSQKIQELKSKIFLAKNKIYNVKEKIDENLEKLGQQGYGSLAQHMLANQQETNDKKDSLIIESIVKYFKFPQQYENFSKQNDKEAFYNQLTENQKRKKAKQEAINNILQQFQYTKKNLNVYRDKNLLQEKVIQNQRQSIQELKKLMEEAQARKRQKQQYRKKLQVIAKQLSKTIPPDHKFGKILSNLAQGRVVDIQKQFHSLNTQEKNESQQNQSEDYGPSNQEQQIMESNVYKWSTSKGIGQLHPRFKVNEHQKEQKNKNTYFTNHKSFKFPNQSQESNLAETVIDALAINSQAIKPPNQSQQYNLSGTVIDALTSNQTSRQDHNHHYFHQKKTSFDMQIIPTVDIQSSYQFIKSEQLFQKIGQQTEDIDTSQNKQINDPKIMPKQQNKIFDSSSMKIDNLSQHNQKSFKLIPLDENSEKNHDQE